MTHQKKMMNKLLLAAVAAAAVMIVIACNPARAEPCVGSEPYPYTDPYNIEECPSDIQAWMDRAGACAHFSSEEPYDDEREAFLLQQMNEQECRELGCDFDALFSKYEGDIAYTGVLIEYAKVTYGDTDTLPPCAVRKE